MRLALLVLAQFNILSSYSKRFLTGVMPEERGAPEGRGVPEERGRAAALSFDWEICQEKSHF